MKARRLGATLLALSVTVLAGCSGSGGDAQLVIGPDGTISRWEPGDGPALPSLKGQTIEGTELDVSAWKGDVVVINQWGSWCHPCQQEAPVLAEVSKSAAPDVHFVGVDVQENGNRPAARAFQAKYGITYPSLDDDDGKHSLALRSLFLPGGSPPQTLVIGRDGRLVGRIVSEVQASILRGLIEDAGGSAGGGPTAAASPSSS